MNKLKAVILEDDKVSVRVIEHLLAKYVSCVQNVGVIDNVDDAVAMIDQRQPDLLLANIHLKSGTCFDVLDRLYGGQVKIVFMSASDSYVLDVFKYNAIDYLTKPIRLKALMRAISKACKFSTTEHIEIYSSKATAKHQTEILDDVLIVPSVNQIKFVKIREILYLKAEGRYTTIYLKDKTKLISSRNVGEYEKLLEHNDYFRIHNSYLVNLDHIIGINNKTGRSCKIVTEEVLPVAKRRMSLFKEFIMERRPLYD